MTSDSGIIHVRKSGNDFYGDGREVPFATIGAALAYLANNPGRIKVGLGQWVESNHVQYEGQYIDGVTSRNYYGTVLRPPSPTADILTFTSPDCGASDLQVYVDTPWTGMAFRLEHALFFKGTKLNGRAPLGFSNANNGGVGIYVYEMEGWHLEDCTFSEFRRGFHFHQGATGGLCLNLQTSVCYEDLVIDEPLGGTNAPGGNRFFRSKFVGAKALVPVRIEGNGQNLFIGADMEESDGQGHNPDGTVKENTVLVASDANQFWSTVGAPQTKWLLSGDQNELHAHRILHRLHVIGAQNILRSPEVFGQLIIDDPTTIVDNEQLRGGTITGTYREPAYKDEITGGGGGTGPAGPAPVLQVGNVTTVAAGGQASAGVRKVAEPATYALDFGLVKGDTGAQGSPGAPGSGGSGAVSGVASSRAQGMVLNDPLVPIVADGIGIGVGQGQNAAANRAFLIEGQPRKVVGSLGSDSMVSYPANLGGLMKASPAVFLPGWGVWSPTSGGADQDRVYGLPGVSVWSTRIDFGGRKRRLTQRWYHVPGYPDALFCELILTLDPTSSDGAATTWPTAASDVAPYVPKLGLTFETKAGYSGQALTADSVGIPFVSGYPSGSGVDPTFYFTRCLTENATLYYEDAAVPAAPFGTGSDSYTTVGGKTFRANVAVTTQQGVGTVFCTRFVVSVGHSLEAAKNIARIAPNQGPEATIEHYESKVAAMPAPANLSNDEAKAWGYFGLTTVVASRTERDWHPERAAYNGTRRRLPFAGLGRWDAVWQFDTAIGIAGYSSVDPELVKSFLDYMLNGCMLSNGFLRRDPTVSTETSVGNFYLARLARRYLAASGDRAFLTALYPKLKTLYQWWTTVASSAYRHPNWPTVRLLTASRDVEVQEVSPVTSGGNYPSGDDWATAIAYDYCVHMAFLAGQFASGDVAFWNAEATAYKAAIRQYCWDPGQGWFQPTMKNGSPSGGQADNLGRFQAVRTYRGFWHLWAGTATPAQAATMRAQIMDPAIFLGQFGVRTVDKRWASYQPDNWVNGGSRPYFDAAVSTGFRRYGFNTDADTVLQRWVDRQNAVGTTPEMTNPDTGTGGFARWLLAGVAVTEAMLAKRAPSMLGVDGGSVAIGLEQVTS